MEPVVRTLGEVADMLKCSQLTVRRMWIRKQFPAPINVGRDIRWRESDIQAWLANQPTSTRYSEKVQ